MVLLLCANKGCFTLAAAGLRLLPRGRHVVIYLNYGRGYLSKLRLLRLAAAAGGQERIHNSSGSKKGNSSSNVHTSCGGRGAVL